jgi:hypothetical protein
LALRTTRPGKWVSLVAAKSRFLSSASNEGPHPRPRGCRRT